MPDSFSKIIAIIVLAIAVFLTPAIWFGNQLDTVTQTYAYNATTEFVDNVCKQGRITQDMYNDLCKKLGNTGVKCSIKMTHTHTTTVPIFDSNHIATGSNEYDMCTYEDEILRQLYTRASLTSNEAAAGDVVGEYHLLKDDYFSVTIENANPSLGAKIRSFVFDESLDNLSIFCVYGGTVRDENY